MAIQFFCPSCGQPIEVDDEMANQTVTCPYCRSAAQTPGTSDPRVRSSAPSADSAEAPMAPVASVADAMVYGQPAPPAKSVLGWVALGLIGVALIMNLVAYPRLVSVIKSIPHPGQNASQQEMEEYQQRVQQAMAPHVWLVPASSCGGCVLPLVSLILAIIALVKRAQPKWPAIASLVMVAVNILWICGSFMHLGMQLAPQTGP